MSVTNTKAKSVYNANGTTTEWNLGFTYDDTVSNVHIYIVDANDNETEVTSNYSIADGVLTYPTTASGLDPLAEGNKLVIVRDTPRTQDIELTSNGKLDGKVLEGGYDKLTLQVQELTEQVNRAVKIPVTEESADNFLDPITAITEAKKEALVEIAQATEPAEAAKDTAVAKAQVATEQATIATNAATSAKAAQVGAEQAEQNATAQAEKAENAVTAFVEGLGTAKNAVIDLGTFDGKTGVTSSRIIEFDKKPIAVSLRFSDTNKKLWLNGTNSTVGIEVVDNTHCNIFYSIASADFVGQNAVKGPFVVQAVIQYALLDVSATETKLGAVQLATKAEAEAGTNDTKAMTPLKTKYAIEANATVKTLRNDVDDLGDQVAAIEGKIPAEATTANQLADKEFVTTITDELAADITALNADIQQINLIKWVQALPATGETKYLYAIPRNEVDKDGKKIVALYLWDGTEWRGAGGTSIDPGISEGDGIKGDYCTTYGIIDAPNGILTNPSGMEVVLKQGVVLQLAGQDIKTTISGDLTHTIISTADCDLFYVSGTTSLMEVAQIVWSRIEPDNGQAGVLAWWNPDNKKWKFKSNDTGNVWAEAVATPVAHIHTNGTTITRIDHIGYRVLDDEVYALKGETNMALTGKANIDLGNTDMLTNCILSAPNGVFKVPNWKEFWKGSDVTSATDRSNVKLSVTGAYTKDKVSLTDANGNWSYVAKFKITKNDAGYAVSAKGRILCFGLKTYDASQSAYAEIQLSDSSGATELKPFFARIRPKFGDTTTTYRIQSTQKPVVDAWNWIKLQKNGIVYTMFYSTDGNSWTSLGQVQAENFSGVPEEITGGFRITRPTNGNFNMYADFNADTLNFFYNSLASTPLVTYDAYTLTVNKGLKVALANGYNADGTPKSEIVTLENDVSLTREPGDSTFMLFIFLCKLADGSYKILTPATFDFGAVPTIPSDITGYKVYLNTTDNKLYEYGSDFSNTYDKFVMLGSVQLTNGKFTQVFPYKPIQLGLEGLGDYVVESQINADGSWYRKYKSGWLEQGGLVSNTSGATGTVQTLLKPFDNASYTLTATARGTFDLTFLITSKTATTFSCAYSSSGIGAYDWRAEGQGA